MKPKLIIPENEKVKQLRTVTLSLLTMSVLITSCAVSVEESPASLGREAGEIFAKEWNSRNSSGTWPASTVSAMYCADVISDFNPSSSWTMDQQFEFTDACAAAMVENFE